MNYRPAAYPNGWTLSPHSQQRMDQMGLTSRQVFGVIDEAVISYPGRPGPDGCPRVVYTDGQLAVVLAPSRRVVITVLWHRAQGRAGCGRAA